MTTHFFIINPAAGKGIESGIIADKLRDGCEVTGVKYEIYQTLCKGDATAFVKRKIAEKPHGDVYRFYACGGDGTLNEVVNGAVDPRYADLHNSAGYKSNAIPDVQVGCIPIGTGNDFVRNFAQSEFFADVTKQLLGDPIMIDCFSYTSDISTEPKYGINMFNVGFDCDVVCRAAELKRKRFMPKSLAYIAGIVQVLVKNLGCLISVLFANGSELTQEFELCAVANGGFCGGGFNSAPRCQLDDGLLDISLIKKVSRRTFLRLVGSYKKGTHLKTRLGRKIVKYIQEKSITFRFEGKTRVCIDGEIESLSEVSFQSVPRSINFILPVGVEYRPSNIAAHKNNKHAHNTNI
ncbi:MAG: hypothetical protein HFE63_04395 [Clostridiales bacterium]|nr:hypothetical protein [Clostridiales bacterium]